MFILASLAIQDMPVNPDTGHRKGVSAKPPPIVRQVTTSSRLGDPRGGCREWSTEREFLHV